MRTLSGYLFVIIDALIPDLGRFVSLRGKLARVLLNLEGAENFTLGRGAKFDTSSTRVTIGPNCSVGSGCKFHVWNTNLTLASGVYIGAETLITSFGHAVSFGDNVQVGTQSIIWANSHQLGPPSKRAGDGTGESIAIGDGSWLGIRCTVLKSIGKGCVVNAGTVVMQPAADNMQIFGNPGRPSPGIKMPEEPTE